MELYVIRHAEALPVGHDGIATDEQRPLSDEGKAQCRALAEALGRHRVRLDKLVTSPLVRARQTAEVLLSHWPPPAPELVFCDELAPGGRRRKLARFLRSLEVDSVGIVGHNPELSAYAGWLIGGKKVQLDLAKAGVARIDFEGRFGKREGTLTWMVTADWYEVAPAVRS
jgi:phosphohistidine phosphatase